MAKLKGENFRVKLDGKVLAMSKSCNIHMAADLEESTTKDTTGNAKTHSVTATSWDGSANGLVGQDATDTTALQGFDLTDLIGKEVEIEYLETQGAKNREAKTGGVKRYGMAIVNDLTLEFPDRADSTYQIQFTGNGELSKQPLPES